MDFTHLHVHTEYSLLDGSNKIKEYVKRLKELGMTAGAITDHGAMYGVLEFYKQCTENGIKPILGCEVYVAPGSRLNKDNNDKYSHLILLAENNQGYQNLVKIVSHGFKDGFYFKPRVDKEILQKYHEGIIALSACIAGEIPKEIIKGNIEKAKELIREHQSIFGTENFFLEMQDHGIREEGIVNAKLIELSKEMNVPLVATNDCHYTRTEDALAHDVLLCIQTGKHYNDSDRMRYEGDYSVKSAEEMERLFPYAKEALENTNKIATRCNVELKFHDTKMPAFPVPQGYTPYSYLRELCVNGLKERYPDRYEKLMERLEYELDCIKTMGFVEYFLIVWDFINYSKQNGISVGPGRGSAGGSIVAYCLKITNIDPVRYNLLFERFLNPERVSMPDIDIDFCYRRRQEVIEYVKKKYGEECVVQIITFGTMAARQVIKDVGRVMEKPYSLMDSIAKKIPKEVNITLSKALEMNPELKELYDTNEEIRTIIDMSLKLEGLPRQTGTHAAGVVICPKPADEYIPLSRTADGSGMVSQFNMVEVEELGHLKMDFLGLRTLTAISDAVDNIKKNKNIDIDINNIDYDDKNVLDFISSGKTDGVFQLESDGMKGFMKKLRPRTIEDLIAGISLYRPGPMDFIPQYISGKNDPENAVYECEELRPILEATYGCIVYQEQVMQIVRDLGGYTLGRSDLVRRAMSKKKQSVMEKERANFVYGNKEEGVPGCIAKGIEEKVAGKIYDTMMDFAKYAFNKSHAACYAIVSYQTAYLKYYYPKEYMASLLTTVMENPPKLTTYIQAGKSQGIHLCPPDINESSSIFTATESGIRYALCGIKAVSSVVADSIVEERRLNGEFKDYEDAVTRLTRIGLNKKAILNLILSGAFDSFKGTRLQYVSALDSFLDSLAKDKKKNVEGQLSLFDDIFADTFDGAEKVVLPDTGEYNRQELLMHEKEVTGIYISGHPLDDYTDIINKYSDIKSVDFLRDEETGIVNVYEEQKITLCGIVKDAKVIYTKKDNQQMCFLTVEDLYGAVDVVVFPKLYQEVKGKIGEDCKVMITGRVSLDEDTNGSIVCESVTPLSDIPVNLWVKFKNEEEYKAKISSIEKLTQNGGKDNLIIYLQDSKQKCLKKSVVNADKALLYSLEPVFGKDNMAITV